MKQRLKNFYLTILEIFTRANFNFKSGKFSQFYDFNLGIFHNDTVSTEISINGYFEKEQLQIVDKIIKKKNTFIDIGANIGNHSLFFRNKFKKIYSFEPHPKIYNMLKFNTEDYKNIEIFPFGISNIIQELDFTLKKSNNISGTNFKEINHNNGKKVYFKKFDDLLNLNSIDFVKIDVEGNEFDVLQSMRKNLINNNALISLEFNPENFSLDNDIIKFLKDVGYCNFYFFATNKPLNLRISKIPIILIKILFFNYVKKISLENIENLHLHKYFLKDNIIISKNGIDLNF